MGADPRERAAPAAGGGLTVATSWREPPPATELKEQRCKSCRRLLCKTESRCRVEIVCPKCGTMNRLPR